MNGRIEELEKQATTVVEGWSDECGTTRYYEFNRKKFAELIILECAEIARLNTRVDSKVYLMIQEHFGVGMSTEDKKTLIKELLGVKG